ncbi:hypothetical protein ATO49_03480 [Mycolicibacterium fortuitum subsp. fortuitum DSM 46621 = ATCC 6841 = JCM 6387]|nr:hypothetical protein ATO49_03480 [Mycolicibacterium fortuitum subsp. fortuitum DSM 46621 = ATCC 6841 = JCM 6387]
MSTDIAVQFERTRQLAAELDAEAAKVKQILEEETALMADIGGTWTGTASDQFNQQYREWNKEATKKLRPWTSCAPRFTRASTRSTRPRPT